MKFLVLGGSGIQGRTVIHDLASDPQVHEVICGDLVFDDLSKIASFTRMDKVRTAKVAADDATALTALMKEADVAIDLFPSDFTAIVNEAAIEAGVSVVNTNYEYDPARYHARAKAKGIAIMPECGLDPGIDLVTYGYAAKKFDSLLSINSCCGGFPEKSACDNPLNYKISWTWRGVLKSTIRDSRIVKDGKVIEIPAGNQHDEGFIHPVDFPDLGRLEAIPNGDAVYFTDLMGITDNLESTGRYSLRWPGWSAFWRPVKQLGFFEQEPVKGFDCRVTPFDFLDQFLGPRLQYRDDEKDLVAMINIFEGLIDDKRHAFTSSLLVERDLETGMMAMSKGVGYTAAIVAGMMAKGVIKEKGVLSPLKHVPAEPFMEALRQRGITIHETMRFIEK